MYAHRLRDLNAICWNLPSVRLNRSMKRHAIPLLFSRLAWCSDSITLRPFLMTVSSDSITLGPFLKTVSQKRRKYSSDWYAWPSCHWNTSSPPKRLLDLLRGIQNKQSRWKSEVSLQNSTSSFSAKNSLTLYFGYIIQWRSTEMLIETPVQTYK